MSGRLVNGILNDCSMSACAGSGMAFDSASPALRSALAQDARARADMRVTSARPRHEVEVELGNANLRAQIPNLNRL